MRVALGADHGGWELKDKLIGLLKERGHSVIDMGTAGPGPADYPDFAEKVALAVAGGQAQRGIVVCGSGVGACIAANKVPGARAGLCHDTYSARQGVEHDDANVLCLGARVIGPLLAFEVVGAWLEARFSGDERHRRRLDKVLAIERRYSRAGSRRRRPSRGPTGTPRTRR